MMKDGRFLDTGRYSDNNVNSFRLENNGWVPHGDGLLDSLTETHELSLIHI